MATLDTLYSLGKSVARGVPQLATGFVDLAALPLTMTGVRKPEQIFGSTAYLTDKGLLPQPQTGLLNQSTELASSMVNPVAAAKGVSVGLLGTFIGKGSKLWNAESNSVAKALEKEGVAPETIWSQTGNVKAPDGKWRQEINDAGSTARFTQLGETNTLPNILGHSTLYESYPDLKDLRALGLKSERPQGQYERMYINDVFQPKGSSLTARAPDEDYLRSTILHEVQHDIQSKEGWATGGHSEMFKPHDTYTAKELSDASILDKIIRGNNVNQTEAKQIFEQRFNRQPEKGSLSALQRVGTGDILENAAIATKYADNPQQAYKNLLGEAEARLTQRRMYLNPEQRLQYFPYSYGKEQYGLDVQPSDLIIKGLLDK